MAVAPTAHLGEDRFLRLAQNFGFVRQTIAKTRDAAQGNYF
jgi:hypothetical protein